MSDLTLHPGQQRVLDSSVRFIGAVSGIQGGKTTVGAIWLNREIYSLFVKGIKGDLLITAPTTKILQQSTLPKYQAFFPKDWGTWKEARQCFDLSWQHPTENRPCRIYVRSTDEPKHLEGMTILRAWLDEVGQMKEEAWTNIQGRLAINMGRAVMTTTPYAMNWFYRDIFKKSKTDPDIEVICWTSKDNPAFPQEEYDRAKRSLTKAIFERRYEGQFTKFEGLVYPDFDYDRHVVPSFPIPESWKKFGGLDFGHSVETAVICVAEDPKEDIFYVYKEFFRAESLLKDLSNFLHENQMEYVLADPQGAQNIAELQKFYGNRNVKAADNKVEIGIERVGTLLKEGRLKFFEKEATHTIEEIEEYHYSPRNPDRADGKDKPVKKNDHCMDGLKYAFSKVLQGMYRTYGERRLTLKQRVRARLSRHEMSVNPVTGY